VGVIGAGDNPPQPDELDNNASAMVEQGDPSLIQGGAEEGN